MSHTLHKSNLSESKVMLMKSLRKIYAIMLSSHFSGAISLVNFYFQKLQNNSDIVTVLIWESVTQTTILYNIFLTLTTIISNRRKCLPTSCKYLFKTELSSYRNLAGAKSVNQLIFRSVCLSIGWSIGLKGLWQSDNWTKFRT